MINRPTVSPPHQGGPLTPAPAVPQHPRRPGIARHPRMLLLQGVFSALAVLLAQQACAGVAMLQPTKRYDASKPLVLTLLFGDDDAGGNYDIPDTLKISASADMTAPVQLTLKREGGGASSLHLAKGEYRKVSYAGALPPTLRGMVRIEPVDYDASAVMVTMVRPDAAIGALPDTPAVAGDGAPAGAGNGSAAMAAGAAADAPAVKAPPAAVDLLNASRISFKDPTYFIIGNSGRDFSAKFQLSFKYRIFQPDDPRSRGLIDNLYLGYTQFSIWDLQAPSSPFRDTNYRPSLYYFLPDLGVANSVVSRMSVAAGLEHESNGQDGAKSRGLNIAFVEPSVSFGKLDDYHFTVAPKIYGYLGPLSDNRDIADYRGNVDLKLSFGKPDGVAFSTLLRKGRNSNAGSADSQLSYPLSQLIPGTAGYLFANYFYGYGESLLTYNQKITPQFRIGFSLSR
ncbi:MAG TPA: phospholipase A [Herbaspirillum sp.]|jgi:outer membrane phospholipase A